MTEQAPDAPDNSTPRTVNTKQMVDTFEERFRQKRQLRATEDLARNTGKLVDQLSDLNKNLAAFLASQTK